MLDTSKTKLNFRLLNNKLFERLHLLQKENNKID